jgi:hypothetical protein
MPSRADILVAQTTGLLQFNGGGTLYMVQTPSGVLYMVYIDSGSDVAFRKSSDGGITWGAPTIVFAGTVTALSIWYDRWSDIAAGLIHCAYQESATDDILYRTINTESSDALSTQTVVFAGASTASGGWCSITRARGGNVYCYGCIDAGAEGGFFRLLNANVPSGAWDAARTNPEALATSDMAILVPGFASDNQDIMCMFWDASANEVSRYIHDDSANTWAETSIAASMTDQAAATAFPHFAATVDITNSQILLVAWSGVDTLNADLRCWKITESAITEVTNVVLNSTDDQGLCGIGIDLVTGNWYVVYGGATDGGENFLTSINLYCKVSKDSGTTWGPETLLTTAQADITWLVTIPRSYIGPIVAAYHKDIALDELYVNVDRTVSSTNSQLGI